LRRLLLVGLGNSCRIPDLKTIHVKADHSPIIRAKQAHLVCSRDWVAASVAGLPEADSVPQFNRAITWKAAIFNPVSNALPNDLWNHTSSGFHIGVPDQ